MRKYFYIASFEYANSDNIEKIDLGTFSSKFKAEEKISLIKNQKGFNQFDQTSFKIIKFGVDFERNDVKKEKMNLYSVWIEYLDEDNINNYVIFDYFSTYKKAKAMIVYYRKHTRIGKKHPEKFEISKIVIDDFHSWSEGFEKYTV